MSRTSTLQSTLGSSPATHTRPHGLTIAAATAVVSGVAVFINGFGVRAWQGVADATTYTTLKNIVAASIIVGVALTVQRGSEAPRVPVGLKSRIGLFAVAVVGGSVPFVLFFEGLAAVSSSQAGIIHKTLIVWVAVLATVVLRERIGWPHLAAIALLVGGQAVLGGGNGPLAFGRGEWLLLAATLLWSIEVVVAKRLLVEAPPIMLGVARMAGGAALLVVYSSFRGWAIDLAALSLAHVVWILATGAVLSLYVMGWYTALARARAVDVTAVLVGGAVVTAVLDVGLRGIPAPPVLGLGLVTAGVVLAFFASMLRPSIASSP
ncbi:MAG: DMT family transporter [Acidimicrobiia bacterium]|nr:DMT family transporter [Acidimicrobiia bacterium]